MLTDLQGMDLDSHLHPYTNFADLAERGALVMKGGSGATVSDVDGNRYIDSIAGLWCCDVGYGRTEIAKAIAEQAHELAFFHSFFGMATEPTIRLADRLKRMMPWPIAKVFFGLSGSGRERHTDQTRLVVQQPAWQAREKENSLSPHGLSRYYAWRFEHDWFARRPCAHEFTDGRVPSPIHAALLPGSRAGHE